MRARSFLLYASSPGRRTPVIITFIRRHHRGILSLLNTHTRVRAENQRRERYSFASPFPACLINGWVVEVHMWYGRTLGLFFRSQDVHGNGFALSSHRRPTDLGGALSRPSVSGRSPQRTGTRERTTRRAREASQAIGGSNIGRGTGCKVKMYKIGDRRCVDEKRVFVGCGSIDTPLQA